ncbi:MAG: diguanylate cyclase [Chromatiales bacterium]|nr:diguanylate cyclase [Chromatiales bacterium]
MPDEAEFLAWYSGAGQVRTRPLLLMTVLVTLLVLIGGSVLGVLHAVTTLFLVFVLTPTLLATLATSRLDGRHEAYQRLLALSTFWIGLICLSVVARATMEGLSHFLALQVAWIFLVWLILGLRFRYAAASALTLSVAHVLALFWGRAPVDEALFTISLLLAVNLIGGYSCFKFEHAIRRSYGESCALAQAAERDGLTGLQNRQSYDRELERLWLQARREQAQLTIALIDIDCFKAFNDRYGHQAGDEALRRVARVIAAHGQRPLDIAARIGGEEFALVLYGQPGQAPQQVAEQLREAVQGLAIEHAGAGGWLTVSIGMAVLLPGSQRSLAGAVQLADEALYQAKEAGRNRVVVRESRLAHIETGRFRARNRTA